MLKHSKGSASRSVTTKKLIVDEYRRRLKGNVRSLSENLSMILQASRVPLDENTSRTPSSGLMAEHYTLCNEICGRTALMARAADELLKLTNDIREFLILRDFSFISHALEKSKESVEMSVAGTCELYDNFKLDVCKASADIDSQLNDNFGLKS